LDFLEVLEFFGFEHLGKFWVFYGRVGLGIGF
jgi:hypothetical protein